MSRPRYAQEYGPGHSDAEYYASDYHGHGYYEDPNYHGGHHDQGYDYSHDPNYYHDQDYYDYDHDYYEYQQPSRTPHPAHSSSSRREQTRGNPAMNPPRRSGPPQSQPSAREASQAAYAGAEYTVSDQWPLPSPSMQAAPESPTRGPRTPPRRPQRPDDMRSPGSRLRASPQTTPHVTPASRQYHQSSPSSHHGNGQWTGDGYGYASPPPKFPPPSHPPPQAAGPQSASPLYTTPQAPRQIVYGQANQRPPLGPPPSARRGTSSFYPQVGPVHPIVEETESMRSSVRTGSFRATSMQVSGHNSKVSVASSNAIPIGLEAPRLLRADFTSSSEDSFVESLVEPMLGQRNTIDSSSGDVDHTPEIMLVRQASLGRKQRPTLTTVKSNEKRGSESSNANGTENTAMPAMPQRSLSQVERERLIAKNKLEGQSRAGASDRDRAAGGAAVKAAAVTATARAAANAARDQPTGEENGGIPPRLAKPFQTPQSPSALPAGNGISREPSKDFAALASELSPARSQPRSPLAPAVDPRVETILQSLERGGAISEKEAEELKSPMGGMSGRKRPPRLDVDAVRNAEARGSLSSLPELIRRATRLASNLDRGKTASRLGMNWIDGARDDEKRRSSGMLSVYPAGSRLTPDSRGERGASFGRWSKMMRHSSLGSDSDAGEAKPKRTCCGMPLWLFILLLTILFLLVAAAVVVPVLLVVVLPNNNASSPPSTLEQCQKTLTCENNGINILGTNGFCECLCVNGYTGSTCQTFSGTGCTMTTIGSTSNVTVGEAIPRLLEDANSNFSIPLDSQTVLGLFSSSDLSCSTQNALVTFNGRSSKRDLFDVEAFLPEMLRRQEPTPTPTSTPSITATATSSTTATATASDKQLDFARVAVLYVLEVSSNVDHAATAQENLQTYFLNIETTSDAIDNARNVSLGNGFTCDLNTLSMELANGTGVGGSA